MIKVHEASEQITGYRESGKEHSRRREAGNKDRMETGLATLGAQVVMVIWDLPKSRPEPGR